MRDLTIAIRLAPDATEPLVALGEIAGERGHHAEAAAWYSRAADRLRDENTDLLYALALARYRAGTPAAAVEPLRRVIAGRDPSGEAHYLLGLVFRDLHQPAAAIETLQEAVRLAPSLWPAREELADLYRAHHRPADELTELKALAALDPQLTRRVAIALAESREGRFEIALATLDELMTTGADHSQIQLARGRIHLDRAERTGDRAAARLALEALEKALGGSARRSEGLALYGRALYLAGDVAAAGRILREAVATSPVDVTAFSYLADAAASLSQPAAARDALIALDALEGDTASRDRRAARARRLGALSLQAGDVPGALRHLHAAIAAGESSPATLGLVAEAHWRGGDIPRAREAIARALELAPGDRALRRLSRSIR
jgi:tetratricopeptide (TPR) repeat protein